MFKTMGYSPGFLPKICQISNLSNSPEIDTNSRARSQNSFQKGFGSISESLERFPGLAQIRLFQNHGLQPRLFAQNRPNFDPLEFTRNRHKQSRKELEIILEGFWRHFREFGAIPRTCPNPPFSKPWVIAQGFCSKSAKFRPSRIHPKSTQTVAQRVRNHFRRVLEAFHRVWSDFQDLPKSAIFKTMGYSPGFLPKICQISNLSNSPEIDTNSRSRSQKSFQKGFGGISESLERFPGLAQILHFQNHGLQPRVFAQKRSFFDPLEFTRNRHKQSRKELEIILDGFRRHFREFGSFSRTLPNPPFSKPWAIAQAFCSKSIKFRPSQIHRKSTQTVAQRVRNHFRRVYEAFQRVSCDFQDLPKSSIFRTMGFCSKSAKFLPSRIHPKSTQTVAQSVRNHFRRVLEAFQRVWSDFQDLPKSAIFKTMGYSPGFLLKNGQISTLSNSPEIDTNSRARSQKSFYKGFGGISESLERFPGLAQIRHFQNRGLQPRVFAQKRSFFDPLEFSRNRHKQSRKELEIILDVFRRHFRELGSFSRTCPNPPFSKPWAIAQAFCSKSAKFRPSQIHPKSTQAVAQAVRNHFRRVLEAFQRVWSDSSDLPKSAMFKTMGYSPGFLLKISQFRPSRIHPKSTQTLAQGVRNHFRRVLEAFQRVQNDFQDLPKSAMFKTMGYSPGFLLKTGQISTLSNSPEIDTNSRAKSQKSFQKSLGGISESLERFPGLAQILHFQNHELQPRVFAQKRSIFDPQEFSRNRHKQSRKELEIILEGFRGHFREFGAISRTCPNPPFSKPWAIAQGFCSKSAKFRPSRIHPKSTQTVARSQKSFYKGFGGISESLERFPGLAQIRHFQNRGLQPRVFAQKRSFFDPLEFSRNRHKQSRKELEIILDVFRRHFRELGSFSRTCPNPPFSKPWAIAQAFCSKSAKFRPSQIHPKSTQAVAQGVRNHFRRVLEAFQRVWSDSSDLPKSAMFKTMGYSPGFLLKISQFRPSRIHPKSTQTLAQGVRNHFRRVLEAFQRVQNDFQDLPKSAMFKTMGYSPGILLKNVQFSTLSNSPEIDTNCRAKSQK